MIRRAGVIVLAILCIAAGPKLVITEIMYDPTSPESDEKETEWVEIHNYGDESINLQGMVLTSGTTTEPHAAKQKYVFRDIELLPGEYLVVGIGGEKYYQGYALPPFAVYCDESRYAWFSNSQDSVAIRDAKKNVIDEVVYDNETPWPISRHGGSIQFICPAGADPQEANDEGKNWVASGASNSEEFKGHGRGTPGRENRGPTTKRSPSKAPTSRPSGAQAARK
jgi:hypothetical protein